MIENCSKTNCKAKAAYVPVLLLRVHVVYKNDTPLQVYFKLPICIECSKTLKVSDVLSNDGWEKIKTGIAGTGRVIPDRNRTTIRLASLEEAEEYWSRFDRGDEMKR